jgi:hypothetical protein
MQLKYSIIQLEAKLGSARTILSFEAGSNITPALKLDDLYLFYTPTLFSHYFARMSSLHTGRCLAIMLCCL